MTEFDRNGTCCSSNQHLERNGSSFWRYDDIWKKSASGKRKVISEKTVIFTELLADLKIFAHSDNPSETLGMH